MLTTLFDELYRITGRTKFMLVIYNTQRSFKKVLWEAHLICANSSTRPPKHATHAYITTALYTQPLFYAPNAFLKKKAGVDKKFHSRNKNTQI